MAKVKITGHASGTGILTVTAPNTSTDRTITLPDATGTLATTTDITSLAGIDDQSSSNDDQLTIKDTEVVVNEDSDDLDFRVESNANDYMFFVDGGTSYCSINGGVGSPEARAIIGGESTGLQIKGNSNSSSTLGITRHTADEHPPALRFLKSRNTTVNSYTVVADDDYLGEIGFHADDGTDYSTRGASIQARVDGTPGTNDMPTELLFNTTADGANDTTPRLVLKSDGRGLSQFTAKGWAQWDGATIADSHNVSSVANPSTGKYTVNWDVDMADGDYAIGTAGHADRALGMENQPTTADCDLVSYSTSGSLESGNFQSVICFGD